MAPAKKKRTTKISPEALARLQQDQAMFNEVWDIFDPEQTGWIECRALPFLLRALGCRTELLRGCARRALAIDETIRSEVDLVANKRAVAVERIKEVYGADFVVPDYLTTAPAPHTPPAPAPTPAGYTDADMALVSAEASFSLYQEIVGATNAQLRFDSRWYCILGRVGRNSDVEPLFAPVAEVTQMMTTTKFFDDAWAAARAWEAEHDEKPPGVPPQPQPLDAVTWKAFARWAVPNSDGISDLSLITHKIVPVLPSSVAKAKPKAKTEKGAKPAKK